MRIYIAGPMTGLKDFNYPAFHHAAAAWRQAGWEVVNPAEAHNGDTSLPYEEYVKHDIRVLQGCQAIAMLPGWNGPGARGSVWEHYIASYILGLDVFDAIRPVPPRTYPSIGEWVGGYVEAAIPITRNKAGVLGRHQQIELELATAVGQADGGGRG